jgi:hypothetical protein
MHAPPESCWVSSQLAHWFAPGPVQVRHEGSHAVQVVSLVAVQTALSNDPDVQVAQLSQVL